MILKLYLIWLIQFNKYFPVNAHECENVNSPHTLLKVFSFFFFSGFHFLKFWKFNAITTDKIIKLVPDYRIDQLDL